MVSQQAFFAEKQLEEYRILDLIRFMLCPESLLKKANKFLMVWQFFWLALANKVRSSVKKRCEIFGPL